MQSRLICIIIMFIFLESVIGTSVADLNTSSDYAYSSDNSSITTSDTIISPGNVSNSTESSKSVLSSNSEEQVLPVAAFSFYTETDTDILLNIYFIDESTGSPTAWYWDFGDGDTSTEQNPVHTYSAAGNYTITLTVRNANGTSSSSSIIDIYELGLEPHIPLTITSNPEGANIKFDGYSVGKTPCTIPVSDEETHSIRLELEGYESWEGEFKFEDQQLPLVQLEPQNTAQSKEITKSLTEEPTRGGKSVSGPNSEEQVLPVASFESDVTAGTMPLTVPFIDTSTGFPTAWKWDFGDGSTSTEQNPMHTYYAAGNYAVTLTVSNANGTSMNTLPLELEEIEIEPDPMLLPYMLLTITSSPEGTNIIFDGENVGKTPDKIPVTDEEEHSIRLELQGYESWEGEFKFDISED